MKQEIFSPINVHGGGALYNGSTLVNVVGALNRNLTSPPSSCPDTTIPNFKPGDEKLQRMMASQGFAHDLSFQVVQNALRTYLDAEIRYNLDYPNTQSMWKISTAASEFCKDEKGKQICTNEELGQISKLVASYRDDFGKAKQTVYGPFTALTALNRRIDLINQLENEVGTASGKVIQNHLNHTSALISLGDEKALRDLKQKLDQVKNDDVGVLLLSKAIQKQVSGHAKGLMPHVSDHQTMIAAVKEVKDATWKLARRTNTLRDLFMVKTDWSLDGQEAKIKEMLMTNPIAAAQVLAKHPEYKKDVCLVGQQLEIDQHSERDTRQLLSAATWGGMVIGGALMVTGVFTPEGAMLEELSSTARTALAVNEALAPFAAPLGMSSMIGNMAFITKDYSAAVNKETNTRQAMMAKTGGDEKALSEAEKDVETASSELTKNILMTVSMAAIPVLGGEIKAGLKISANSSKWTNAFVSLLESAGNTKTAKLMVGSLDQLCMLYGNERCMALTGALNGMRHADPDRFKKIMGDEREFTSFIEEQMEQQPNSKVAYVEHLKQKAIAEGLSSIDEEGRKTLKQSLNEKDWDAIHQLDAKRVDQHHIENDYIETSDSKEFADHLSNQEQSELVGRMEQLEQKLKSNSAPEEEIKDREQEFLRKVRVQCSLRR